MLVLRQNFEMVPEKHEMAYDLCIIFLYNPLPCASELIVGYQFLSKKALKMILILYIELGHYSVRTKN